MYDLQVIEGVNASTVAPSVASSAQQAEPSDAADNSSVRLNASAPPVTALKPGEQVYCCQIPSRLLNHCQLPHAYFVSGAVITCL